VSWDIISSKSKTWVKSFSLDTFLLVFKYAILKKAVQEPQRRTQIEMSQSVSLPKSENPRQGFKKILHEKYKILE